MPAVTMSFGALERALVTALRVDPERSDAFRARLKQLQRLGFPPGVNVGRGTKMEYNTTHMIQLMFAFELISTGIPAKTATELVLQGWVRIAAACQVIGSYDPILGGDNPEVLVVFRPDLLWQNPSSVLPTIEDLASLRNSFGPLSMPGTHVLIEASKMIGRLFDVGGNAGRLISHSLYQELREWPKPPKFDWTGEDEDNWFRAGAFDADGVVR